MFSVVETHRAVSVSFKQKPARTLGKLTLGTGHVIRLACAYHWFLVHFIYLFFNIYLLSQ